MLQHVSIMHTPICSIHRTGSRCRAPQEQVMLHADAIWASATTHCCSLLLRCGRSGYRDIGFPIRYRGLFHSTGGLTRAAQSLCCIHRRESECWTSHRPQGLRRCPFRRYSHKREQMQSAQRPQGQPPDPATEFPLRQFPSGLTIDRDESSLRRGSS